MEIRVRLSKGGAAVGGAPILRSVDVHHKARSVVGDENMMPPAIGGWAARQRGAAVDVRHADLAHGLDDAVRSVRVEPCARHVQPGFDRLKGFVHLHVPAFDVLAVLIARALHEDVLRRGRRDGLLQEIAAAQRSSVLADDVCGGRRRSGRRRSGREPFRVALDPKVEREFGVGEIEQSPSLARVRFVKLEPRKAIERGGAAHTVRDARRRPADELAVERNLKQVPPFRLGKIANLVEPAPDVRLRNVRRRERLRPNGAHLKMRLPIVDEASGAVLQLHLHERLGAGVHGVF
mmetsp:Transcript_25880/g.85156  ORF Transcript_25880/g.85156 Transcript_25880/m.85156 type:complete len:292 (-) Transcript_25880:1522-2397(-)